MYTFAFLGMNQIIIILVLVLLVFGPQKVPEIAKQIGGALRDLKKMSNEVQQAFDVDEHLSYDRYEPPTYEYHPPVETTHAPLDQYGLVEPEHPVAQIEGTVEATAVVEAVVEELTETPEISVAVVTEEIALDSEASSSNTEESSVKSESAAETHRA